MPDTGKKTSVVLSDMESPFIHVFYYTDKKGVRRIRKTGYIRIQTSSDSLPPFGEVIYDQSPTFWLGKSNRVMEVKIPKRRFQEVYFRGLVDLYQYEWVAWQLPARESGTPILLRRFSPAKVTCKHTRSVT